MWQATRFSSYLYWPTYWSEHFSCHILNSPKAFHSKRFCYTSAPLQINHSCHLLIKFKCLKVFAWASHDWFFSLKYPPYLGLYAVCLLLLHRHIASVLFNSINRLQGWLVLNIAIPKYFRSQAKVSSASMSNIEGSQCQWCKPLHLQFQGREADLAFYRCYTLVIV